MALPDRYRRRNPEPQVVEKRNSDAPPPAGQADHSTVYASVDSFAMFTLGEISSAVKLKAEIIGDDITLESIDGIPDGTYRLVDGKFLGWMEWMAHNASKRSDVLPDKIEEARRFIKQVKERTGIGSDFIDVQYRRPQSYKWVHELIGD